MNANAPTPTRCGACRKQRTCQPGLWKPRRPDLSLRRQAADMDGQRQTPQGWQQRLHRKPDHKLLGFSHRKGRKKVGSNHQRKEQPTRPDPIVAEIQENMVEIMIENLRKPGKCLNGATTWSRNQWATRLLKKRRRTGGNAWVCNWGCREWRAYP